MASSLFLLLDDIATALDDIGIMTKVAAKKSAGVLGDDLALNAEQVTGVRPQRELAVVWAVAKGSMRNKCILVPAALVISALIPWMIIPLLILGGAFLCFEGVEKIAHKLLHKKHGDGHHPTPSDAPDDQKIANAAEDLERVREFERNKIRGAIRTDFILSAEIVVITLGIVADKPLFTRFGVLAAIATLMTVSVYGLVAGIVKLDDAGLALTKRSGTATQKLGHAILFAAPWLMRFLSVAGTAAMFLVGGGILTHNIDALHKPIVKLIGDLSEPTHTIAAMAIDGVIGILLGILVVLAVTGIKQLLPNKSEH